ncbi:ABC transporter [Synergistales bacterium]|nr:ABC transporter [Synergistales bacterium]
MVLTGKTLVEMRGVTKRFSGVTANKAVNFSLEAGEVHALLGENGAGKSTLMNVLYGLYRPDAGEIFVNGSPVEFRSPADAIAAGIGMVHQHFMLVQTQTVWENMILGMKDIPFFLPEAEIQKKIASISERYGLLTDPRAKVEQLSVGEQQRVAILRMLYRGARVLILDEPTSVLTPQESDSLFSTVRRVTAEGYGVVFISHKMNEVLKETNRVTVLRRGSTVSTVATAGTDAPALSEMMMGHRSPLDLHRAKVTPGERVFEALDIHARGERAEAVSGLSLFLRSGEILGVAGVAGNGQRELCECLVGLRPVTSGTVSVRNKNMTNASPRRFINQNVHYIPADRGGVGMATGMNVRENSILRSYWSKPISTGTLGELIDWKEAELRADRIVEDFNVAVSSPDTPVRNLSGGNLQKLLMGRELSDSLGGDAPVLIVMHPTWGLDVAATRYVRERILERRENGAAVLLVSEDLDELLAMSDRLAVLFGGKFMGILEHPEGEPISKIGLMMAGTAAENCAAMNIEAAS